MVIDLSLLEEGTSYQEFLTPAEIFTAIDILLHLITPVKTQLQFIKTGNNILLNGISSTSVELSCSRCLEPFVYSITAPFSYELRQKPELATPTAINLEFEAEETLFQEDAAEIVYYTGTRIELIDEIRQELELAIPMQPLCSENCAGLCIQCGANLNKGKCSCPPIDKENPFAVLKQKIKPKI
ncbi:MAG: DUF177 domain-containing protein [bacterium]|nr:DUF177 domain-containing protein [bacterium]